MTTLFDGDGDGDGGWGGAGGGDRSHDDWPGLESPYGQDEFGPDDPLAVILRPPATHLGPPPGRYEAVRRAAGRRRLARTAIGAGVTCAAALLVILPLRTSASHDPAPPLAPPPASGPAQERTPAPQRSVPPTRGPAPVSPVPTASTPGTPTSRPTSVPDPDPDPTPSPSRSSASSSSRYPTTSPSSTPTAVPTRGTAETRATDRPR
ncbi:hypothetical protein ACIQU5_26790 [Streptomyces sp. NPDC090306]|uniref:hypothetical protein n=1 Tax=Streptomyces sp. NPDC090306 TaxID=3365961 RepID=UPI00381805A5